MSDKIYIKCKEPKLSKHQILIYLTTLNIGIITSLLFFNQVLIKDLFSYLVYTISPIVTLLVFHLYYIFKIEENQFILITDEFLLIKDNSGTEQQDLKLSFTSLKGFETRFNAVIFHHQNGETYRVGLDNVKCDTKRWEIKEFLRNHIEELKPANHIDGLLVG
jgi:hypothetical protein